MKRYYAKDGFIYDSLLQLDLGCEEAADLLNYLIEELEKIEQNK